MPEMRSPIRLGRQAVLPQTMSLWLREEPYPGPHGFDPETQRNLGEGSKAGLLCWPENCQGRCAFVSSAKRPLCERRELLLLSGRDNYGGGRELLPSLGRWQVRQRVSQWFWRSRPHGSQSRRIRCE